MKSKIICFIIILALISNTALAFATTSSRDDENYRRYKTVEQTSDIFEFTLGNDNLNKDIEEHEDCYTVNGKDFNIAIPRKGIFPIEMQLDDCSILMALPKNVFRADAELTENGTIVYNGNDDNLSILVQTLKDKQASLEFYALRILMLIQNSSAPTEYCFDYNLPEGYSLISDYDFPDEWDGEDCGAVYLLDDSNEIVLTIEPAWAMDANGNCVETYYSVKDNMLIQTVKFDDTTAFPVIADPTEHPTRYTKMYYTRSGLDEIIDQYSGMGIGPIINASVGFIASVVGAFVNSIVATVSSGIGTIWSCISLSGTIYNSSQKTTWKAIRTALINSGKTYALVKYPWTWHKGQRSYYPHGNLSATYANTISD